MRFILIIIFIILGLITISMPFIRKINTRTVKKVARKKVNTLSEGFESEDEEDVEKYEALYADMEAYNIEIHENGQLGLTGELPENEILFDTSAIMPIDIFGYAEIVRKKNRSKRRKKVVKEQNIFSFPIYLAASKKNLKNGFATLPNTSLPIGGENTLSVLYGYAKEKLFKDKKCKIEAGDKIILTNPFEEIVYRVYDSGAIKENETEYLKIIDGETEIALLMFMPNSKYRFCIYAKLVAKRQSSEELNDFDEYEEDEFEDEYED